MRRCVGGGVVPRGRPKAQQKARALVETLATQTDEAQAVVVREKLAAVERFQERLEGELDRTFEVLRTLRDTPLSPQEAAGAKVNLAAAQTMMAHTHRLHPERQGGTGQPVTITMLVQLLCKPPGPDQGTPPT